MTRKRIFTSKKTVSDNQSGFGIDSAFLNMVDTVGLLICTLISENQGLEKSRYVSNLRKISGPANLNFFIGLHLEKS